MAEMMDIPNDKNYPDDAVQCNGCGGHGCGSCSNRGWVSLHHPNRRECVRPGCNNPIPPNQVAVYCSDFCAAEDAQ
jgi:hypothetical protein